MAVDKDKLKKRVQGLEPAMLQSHVTEPQMMVSHVTEPQMMVSHAPAVQEPQMMASHGPESQPTASSGFSITPNTTPDNSSPAVSKARQAFYSLPVRDAETNAAWAKHDRQWQARQPKQRVYRSAPAPQQALLQKGNGMGWKQRTALNKQILANNQSGANNASTNATARANQSARSGLLSAQAANANAQAQGHNADTELDQMGLEYADPNTTPERKSAIEAYYKLLGKGPTKAGLTVTQPQTVDEWNPELNMFVKKTTPATIVNKDTGTSREVVPENDDPYEYRTNADGTKSRRLKTRS